MVYWQAQLEAKTPQEEKVFSKTTTRRVQYKNWIGKI